MTKNLLPPLNDDHQVPEISIEGEWTEETNSILARISNGLKSAKLEQDSEELVSVPDVWARTAVVANALYDERHPLHNQIVVGDVGLVALLYHKQTIETEVINLNNLSSDPYKTKGETLQSGNFAEVLAAITPSKKLINSQNWNEYGLIKINKKVIGLLVPSTIICPARYYGKSIDSSIPWFQVGKLIDPCLAADIRSEEFSVLINFIERLTGLAKESMSTKNTLMAS